MRSEIAVASYEEMTTLDLLEWRKIQNSTQHFDHPFLSPGFTAAISAVRPGVKIALFRSEGATVGFFPFQEIGAGVAEPVGGRISDYQAVIVNSGYRWEVERLFRICGIVEWSSRHLLAAQREFEPWRKMSTRSHTIDLNQGYNGWTNRLSQRGSQFLLTTERSERKFRERHGPISIAHESGDIGALQKLMDCKSEQYRRTGSTDRFAVPWIRSALEYLHTAKEPYCTGMLSTLSVDGNLAAAHFGLRSETVWHYWFPCYSVHFAHYSPGSILLAHMIRHAGTLGIASFDLGAGESLYKLRLATNSIPLQEVTVRLPY